MYLQGDPVMTMKQIWVATKPGQIVSKPDAGPRRLFTEAPELVDLTSAIMRMLQQGDLVEVDPPALSGEEEQQP